MNNPFRNLVKKPAKHEKGEIVVADSGNVKEVAKIMIGFEALLRETQSYMSKACGNKLFDSDLKDAMRQLIKQYMKDHNYYVPHMNLAEAADRLYVEMAEYSFLTPLLARKDIEEININSWDDIQIIPSKGQQYKYLEHFSSAQHAVDVVRRMLHNNKLVFDASRPLVTGYLDKNIRISAVHSLIVGDEVGVSVSIRIVNPCKITKHRRLITIEKSVREFDLVKRDENGEKINNVVHLVTYESDDPTRCVTMQDLLTKCLTMHPDAICVAEMKNEEAWEAQEAARTGHTVLTTTHASGVQGIYPRLATLCMQKHSTPYPTLISFVTEAFPLAVFLKKLDDGKRHIMEIAECLGCDEKGKVFTKTLWKYRVDSERIVDGKTVIDGRFVRVNPISKELRERMHENGVPNDVLDRFSEVR